MSDVYSNRQAKSDIEYERAYREWIASLPPSEVARLEGLGLHVPHVSYHGSGGLDKDVADSPIASERPDIAKAVDRDDPAENPILDVVRRIVGEILSQPNRSLAVECLALASGVSFTGQSQTDIGARHSVSRAAVSKRCIEITLRIGLPPSRAMRQLTARGAYADAQLTIRHDHSHRQSHRSGRNPGSRKPDEQDQRHADRGDV